MKLHTEQLIASNTRKVSFEKLTQLEISLNNVESDVSTDLRTEFDH